MAAQDCVRKTGAPNIVAMKKKASTAIALGDILYVDSSGFVLPADASSTGNDTIGVAQEAIASTDADYAVAREIAVDAFQKGNEGERWVLVVGTGTPSQTMVGEAHDLASGGTADLVATTTKVIKVHRIIDSTHVEVSFLNTGDLA